VGKSWEPEGPEDIAAIMEMVSSKVPDMIKGIMGAFFNPEAASNIAKSVAEFRKTLIEGGVPEKEALQMTKDYLHTLTNWNSVLREARIGSHHTRED